MSIPTTSKVFSSRLSTPGRASDLKAVLWPIIKRSPSYLRLGWSLAREPAIEQRHKTLLYATVLYQVTPVSLVLSAIPVLGQLDTLMLLLLGLRQVLAHCPAEVAARHCEQLNLTPTQLETDLKSVLTIATATAAGAAETAGYQVGRKAYFAGRALRNFSHRARQRLSSRRTRGARK